MVTSNEVDEGWRKWKERKEKDKKSIAKTRETQASEMKTVDIDEALDEDDCDQVLEDDLYEEYSVATSDINSTGVTTRSQNEDKEESSQMNSDNFPKVKLRYSTCDDSNSSLSSHL